VSPRVPITLLAHLQKEPVPGIWLTTSMVLAHDRNGDWRGKATLHGDRVGDLTPPQAWHTPPPLPRCLESQAGRFPIGYDLSLEEGPGGWRLGLPRAASLLLCSVCLSVFCSPMFSHSLSLSPPHLSLPPSLPLSP
jgi:hypothetical protein